jgi:hypothetical protein
MSGWLKPRAYADVARDMDELWGIDPELAIRFALYTRMVTRKTKINGKTTEKSQKGQGLKHEGLMRLVWLGVNHPAEFKKNAWLIPIVGSWKSVIDLLRYDLLYNGNGWEGRQLDWHFIAHLIQEGLKSDQRALVKDYLPAIRNWDRCNKPHQQANHTIGAWLSAELFSEPIQNKNQRYKRYRKMKTSGSAKSWQKALSTQNYAAIDFGKISGRALNLLATGKFLQNHNLVDRYNTWLADKPVAKYTGYVHELFAGINPMSPYNASMPQYKLNTINKQFLGLVDKSKVKEGNNTWLAVFDTSGSMGSKAYGTKQSSISIAVGLGLFMSYLLPEGEFSNTYMTFDNTAKLHQWRGDTPLAKYQNVSQQGWGSTEFLSIANTFIQMKRQGVPESHFPQGLVCFSDGEFNSSGTYSSTNFEEFKRKLLAAGFSKSYVDDFTIVLWDIHNEFYGSNRKPKFESYSSNEGGLMYFSGFDASVLAFLMGDGEKVIDPATGQAKRPRTPRELFNLAMNQEVLQLVKV